ncbi:SDR family NAD(P)-dependent oxidoreductase [Alkalibaculum sp. M08DMB]|uniref:SDR family NAD(P)-dependent oxidoreductase n=1 Tax=Alkalibaculum sporogenes TaxID=2655001 RepID=A0A6A7K4G7_9FIRM|nr:SDR family NAD(P)-dependent oxidoreductase [Alkalibaculum sporogenes]MPW24278.1 SDR family NAD(P)-dependent oxidoreductase [Alkalibaculum sporogenes]
MGKRLSGKVAIVTGSGQGIGRAIAIALAEEGAKVVTNNRGPVKKNVANQLEGRLELLTSEQLKWYNEEIEKYTGDAETTAKTIRDAGFEAVAIFGDISNFDEAKKIVDRAADIYGSVDIVVNVAGAFGFAPIEKITEELWDKVTDVKPKGHFNIIRHAVPYMKKNKWGRIINCASPAWMGGGIRQSEYCAANAGTVGLTWALAEELADDGITANVFCPAAKTRASVDMELFDKVVDEDEKSTKSGEPLVKYDETQPPELFSAFIPYLASDDASHVSGSVFFTMGTFIGRYSNPAISSSMISMDGPWTVDKIIEEAPKTIFKDYKNINQQ